MEGERLEAVGVKGLSAFLSESGQHAQVKVVRTKPTKGGETDFHLTVPFDALPSVVNVMLQLMGPSDESANIDKRRCFEARAVELGSVADGRTTVTFQLKMGGRIGFVMNDGSARDIAEDLVEWLTGDAPPSYPTVRH